MDLLISNSSINQISLHWAHALASSVSIGIIIFIITVLVFLMCANDKHKHPERFMICDTLVILIVFAIGMIYDVHVSDNDINHLSIHARVIDGEIADYKPSLRKGYSKWTIPSTAKIIKHNEKIVPKEWNHDRKIYNTDVKPYSKYQVTKKFQIYMIHRHRWSNYQHKIFKQKYFDKVNRPFTTRKYIHNPKWYDYL